MLEALEGQAEMFVLPAQQDVKNGHTVYGEVLYLSEYLGKSGTVDGAHVAFSNLDVNTGDSVYKVIGGE